MYASCKFSKAYRLSTKGSIKAVNPQTGGTIHTNYLFPGSMVSVNLFESFLKGGTFFSRSGMNVDQYVGGFIYVDSMILCLHIEH